MIPITFSPQHQLPSLPHTLAKLAGSAEVVLIELQGSLDVVGDRRGGMIGTVSLEKGVPRLTIGHHLLEGKWVSLSKPLALLSRRDEEDAAYDVITLVKRKMTFSTRPIPIIT